MFRRKLCALSYKNEAQFDPHDENQLRQLIVWLEETKINEYKDEKRHVFLDTPLPEWLELYSTFLHDLNCPFERSEVNECVDWLLGYAVRLEYAHNAQNLLEFSMENSQNSHKDEDPFSAIQYDSPQMAEGLNRLAALLNVQPHPQDPKVTLRALASYSERYLSKKTPPQSEENNPAEPIDMARLDLGFDTKDSSVNQAAKILRLLFLEDLRNLQTRINEAIVAVQSLTADPRTDTRLGKVGVKQ